MINIDYFLAIFLIFLRVGAFLMLGRIFFPSGTPGTVKAFFAFILSYMIVGGIDYSVVNSIDNNFLLMFYCVNEVMTGIILAMIVNICFDFIKFAGAWMDTHIGLSMISLFDASSQSTSTLLSNIFHWIGIMVFFLIDGHYMLIKSLIESFQVVSLGTTIIYQETINQVFLSISQYFIIGLKIAIPIVLIIIIADVCMGLVSRSVPQLNVMILGMPLKILVGFLCIIIAMPILVKFIISAFNLIPEIFRGIYGAIPLVFIFADDKTEEATPKKKSESRKKGQLPRSKDVGLAFTLLICTLVISLFSGFIAGNFKSDMIYFLSSDFKQEITDISAKNYGMFVMLRMAMGIFPVVIPIMVGGVVASLMQTGFLLTGEPLKPSLGKLNPLKGIKNMFSKRSLLELVKNLIVISIIGYLAYDFVMANYKSILSMGNVYFPSLGLEIKNLVMGIFTKITMLMIVLAIIDYVLQRRIFSKEMRMSKQEVKEEFKQMEGDPQVKGKIKQKQREMATRRMMQAVPDATVVITNPTHIAVALKYEEGGMNVPKVTAIGADNIAIKIKEIAKDNDIPIIENKPLARAIYDTLDIGSEIPGEMYQAIAEILALVFKMKKQK
ncbi:fused FliR family export protein/FlhB family type III secretion system protein [Clostridium intestinale]|uniref:fused FliR family export protein/FlhB family type III secretion system protein n=1 Tax=Clostridium intestinale TaxID=36845 RepID=UPI002DD69D49|nr:fused FliR family export protein/FlhB family type III secretion system protein [Clostridium intestinale]WRY53817.1 fused FliR family export protein/FlhB family type III secretion system protein [Clostridium intestinale]